MQRLHADDLVAHVQQHEQWDVLSFPAIAERDEHYDFLTPYGRKQITRRAGELLQPNLLSQSTLESQRLAMTEYNFVAQYQQDPQPPSGVIVKRHWLKYYEPNDLPKKFERIVQSWDTANKDSELANFSVCRARLFELRAAMSLARLWADQRKQAEARDLLVPIYEWFTEGFNTPDLKSAKEQLERLN
jgi:hypothetical protein